MKAMKYTENYGKKRLGAGFYVAIALCLLIIGGAAWFALAPLSEVTDEPSSKPESSRQEYTDPTPSYTESNPEIITEPTPSTDVLPSNEETESTTEEVKATEDKVISFTMPVQGEIIKKHSNTELQYSKTFGDMRLHTGLDIACKEGTSVSACAGGKVTAVKTDSNLGDTVVIDHGNGMTVSYSAITGVTVAEGDRINTGDVIGISGTVPAECNDDPHIHIEVAVNGEPADPLKTFGLE